MGRRLKELSITVFFCGTLVSCGEEAPVDSNLKIFAQVDELSGHRATVTSVAFLPGSTQAVSTSQDSTVRVWDLQNSREIRRFQPHGDNYVEHSSLSSDGQLIVTTSISQKPVLCSVETGEVLQVLPAVVSTGPVAVSGDGEYVLYRSPPDGITLYSLESREIVSRLPTRLGQVGLWFSPDGKCALVGGNRESIYTGEFALWDLKTQKMLHSFRMTVDSEAFPYRAGTKLSYIGYLPDGKRALLADTDRNLRLWDVNAWTEIKVYEGIKGSISRLAISPNGKYILFPQSSGLVRREDNWLALFDLDLGKVVARTPRLERDISCVAFSSDGKLAISGDGIFRSKGDCCVHIWKLPEEFTKDLQNSGGVK